MKMYGFGLLLLCAGMSYAMEEKAKEKPTLLQKVNIFLRRGPSNSSSGAVPKTTKASKLSLSTIRSTGSLSPRSPSGGGGSPRVRFNEDSNTTHSITSDPDERKNMAPQRQRRKSADSTDPDRALEIAGVIQLPMSTAYYVDNQDPHDAANNNNSTQTRDEALGAMIASLKSLKAKPKNDDDNDGDSD